MNILCFGDSNTYGYDPRGYWGGCYEKAWPQHLAEKSNWNVLNDGENGREIPKFQPSIPEKTDFFIVMLGTNDLLQGNAVETIAKRMETFLSEIHLEKAKVLLISPTPLKLGTWVSGQHLIAASKALSEAYQALSGKLNIGYLDSGEWDIPLAFDGVHFTEEGHRVFGEKLYEYLKKEGAKSCSMKK